MESFRNKYIIWKPKMVSLTAVLFISLCVSTSAAEPRKCYWCGPLAEQVHKSTRAPSCNEPTVHVTACDPGLTHCAVVATSPPYVESRLCVKLYQDECYSLYCNSTKIWRMTCPCLGDLCNGPNTQREKEAFSILTKLAEKSQNARNKRTLLSPRNFITNEHKDIDNNTIAAHINTTTNSDNQTVVVPNVQLNEAKNENIVEDFKTPDKNTDVIKVEVTATIHETDRTRNDTQNTTTQKNIQSQPMYNISPTVPTTQVTTTIKNEESSTISISHPTRELPTTREQQNESLNQKVTEAEVLETTVKNTVLAIPEKQTIESTINKTEVSANIIPTVPTTQITAAIKHEELSSVPHPPSQELPNAEALQQNANNAKLAEPTVANPSDKTIVNTHTLHVVETAESTTYKTHIMDNMTSTVSTKQVTTAVKHEESSDIHLTHPIKESPTAEALQQNASHNEKLTEPPVTKPSEPSEKNTANAHTAREIGTPEPTTYKNNTATQINNCVLTLVSGFLLHRCL